MARSKDNSILPVLSAAIAENAKTLTGVAIAIVRFRRNRGAVQAFYDLLVKANNDLAIPVKDMIAAVKVLIEETNKKK